jgi:NAD(P)-dependent dehydrogenase (short-subunit alcohol dehydrogenase family)
MKPADGLRTFAGAVAIVTGGASGIGRALGEALAARGARVVLADLQENQAREVVEGIRAKGGSATSVMLDVSDFTATRRVIDGTYEREGRLDYLFNNAGIGILGEVRYYTLEDWSRLVDVNLRGVIHGVQAAYPLMIRQGFGHIVNTASGAGLIPTPMVVGYCATKHAVVGLSTSLRIEAATAGVRVSVLCPGAVRTPALIDCGVFGRVVQPFPRDVQQTLVDRQHPMRPERFAERALNAVARNRAIIVIPSYWKVIWGLNRLSPAFGFLIGKMALRVTRRAVERALAAAPTAEATRPTSEADTTGR